MFILRKINKNVEHNIELGETYIYVPKDNKQEFEHVYTECFGCEFGNSVDPSGVIGFILASSLKMDEVQDRYYPIYKDENSYIMLSDGKTFCKLY